MGAPTVFPELIRHVESASALADEEEVGVEGVKVEAAPIEESKSVQTHSN